MLDDFIKMIDNIDFLYGFIYECANLINNLYDYENYDHLVIKLCSEFIRPITNITRKRHIKEYNMYIKGTINVLKHNKYIFIICSYLMNICCERYFKLSQDEYLEINIYINNFYKQKFIYNNVDIIESAFVPMIDYFDLYKKCYGHYYCSCHSHYYKKKLKIFFLVMNIMNFIKKF